MATRTCSFARLGYPAIKLTAGPLVRGLWVHSVTGLENIPRHGGLIVAANHESYLDERRLGEDRYRAITDAIMLRIAALTGEAYPYTAPRTLEVSA